MNALIAYAWPGNARELQNLIERAVIRSDDGVLPNPLPVKESWMRVGDDLRKAALYQSGWPKL